MLRKLQAESTNATASISVRAQALVFRIKVECLRVREDHCNDDLALLLATAVQPPQSAVDLTPIEQEVLDPPKAE